jgi:hypothetical protein
MKNNNCLLVVLLPIGNADKKDQPAINSKGSSQAFRSNYDRIFTKDQKAN